MEIETIFTKIIKREIPSEIIYEDENHIAFLDITPFEKGHTLVVPKKPYETIFEMPEDEYVQLQKIVYKISKHYNKILNCGINIWQNNKEISGQEVNHVHFHIVPRKEVKQAYYRKYDEKYLGFEMKNLKQKLKLN